jgi:hypothetical protein
MTHAEAKARIEAIEAERNHLYEMQYRYGYIADRMTLARLYQEQVSLQKMLDKGVS